MMLIILFLLALLMNNFFFLLQVNYSLHSSLDEVIAAVAADVDAVDAVVVVMKLVKAGCGFENIRCLEYEPKMVMYSVQIQNIDAEILG